MSYYTLFYTKELTLRKDTPTNVINFLRKAFDDYVNYEDIECFGLSGDYDFLKDDRDSKEEVFRNFSIFYGELTEQYFIFRNGYWRLKIHAELNKCYGLRERNFAKWINQYIAGHKDKNYIGYYINEDWKEQVHLKFDNVNKKK